MTEINTAIAELEQARPGWKWSLSNYQHGHFTLFLHYPDGVGCVHADGDAVIDAVRECLILTDPASLEERSIQKRQEREAEERADLERLKAKYEPASSPSPGTNEGET